MKTKILIGFALSAALLFSNSVVNAQNPQVQTGSTVSYTVTPVVGSDVNANGYTWTLSGGASGFSAATTNTQSITWNVVGNNNVLSVTPKSSHNCLGTAQTMTIDVVAALSRNITWDATAVGLCSGDVFASNVTVTGAVPTTDFSFSYTVDANPAIAVSPALALTSTSAVSLAAVALTNASNTVDASHTIHIVSFIVDGQSFTPGSSVDKTFTVFMVPAVGAIH
jgi:hypothetical protein